MEVKISNISRYASPENIRSIFGCLGDILGLDFHPSSSRKDGTFEADIVYSNLQDAALALQLSRTELGDRVFTVEPLMNRFRFAVSPQDKHKVSFAPDSEFGGQEAVKTLLLRGLNSEIDRAGVEAFVGKLVGEAPLKVALYGRNIQKVVDLMDGGGDFDSAMAAVEFSSRDLMLRAILLLRDAKNVTQIVAQGKTLLADEAWKMVDPDVKRPDQLASEVKIYGIPLGKLVSAPTAPSGPSAGHKASRDRSSGTMAVGASSSHSAVVASSSRSSSSSHAADEHRRSSRLHGERDRHERSSRHHRHDRSRERDRERERDRGRERGKDHASRRRHRSRSRSRDRKSSRRA